MAVGAADEGRTRRDETAPSAPVEAGDGTWTTRRKAALTWSAGVAAAVLIGVVGVVFNGWFIADGGARFDQLTGVEPVKVASVRIDDESSDWVLPQQVTAAEDRVVLFRRSSPDAFSAFLRRVGAVRGDRLSIGVVLVGTRANARIVDVVPRILREGRRLDGALLLGSSAGGVDTILVKADLGDRAPRFRSEDTGKRPYFQVKQVDLARNEATTLQLDVTAGSGVTDFELVITVVADGSEQTVVVRGPDDEPFRVTATVKYADGYGSVYMEASDRWTPVDYDVLCRRFARKDRC